MKVKNLNVNEKNVDFTLKIEMKCRENVSFHFIHMGATSIGSFCIGNICNEDVQIAQRELAINNKCNKKQAIQIANVI